MLSTVSSNPSIRTIENVPHGLGGPNGPTHSKRGIKNLSESEELEEEQEPSELGKMRRVSVWQMTVSKTSMPLQLGSSGKSIAELKHSLRGVRYVLQSVEHLPWHKVMLRSGLFCGSDKESIVFVLSVLSSKIRHYIRFSVSPLPRLQLYQHYSTSNKAASTVRTSIVHASWTSTPDWTINIKRVQHYQETAAEWIYEIAASLFLIWEYIAHVSS